jgi:large subunit ribosomal protein L21
MYAVIETGGKQYRVTPGQTVEVELLPAEPGAQVTLDRVLLVSTGDRTLVGTPTVAGGHVMATVTREGRGKKIVVFRFKSKKRYRRKTGHRQDYTYLTITDIQADGKSLVPDEERRRYEELARRWAERYEQRLLERVAGPVDALAMAQALGDEREAARDADLIEAEGRSAEAAPTARGRRPAATAAPAAPAAPARAEAEADEADGDVDEAGAADEGENEIEDEELDEGEDEE